MKHIKIFEKFLNENESDSMESFLEDYITNELTDRYGSMSYTSGELREGEYTLDKEISQGSTEVWAELCVTEDDFNYDNKLITSDYAKFAKSFEEAAKTHNWTAEIRTVPEKNIIVLSVTA